MASDRRDDPELRKMGADSIDHPGLLADEQVTGTVQRQAALFGSDVLLATNRMLALVTASQIASASMVPSVPLYMGLYVGRWHQAATA